MAAADGRKSTTAESRRTGGLSDARKRQIRGTRQPNPNSRAGATPRRYMATSVSTTRRGHARAGNSATRSERCRATCCIATNSGQVVTRRLVGRPRELLPWLRGVERPARMVYEARPATRICIARSPLSETRFDGRRPALHQTRRVRFRRSRASVLVGVPDSALHRDTSPAGLTRHVDRRSARRRRRADVSLTVPSAGRFRS